MLSPLHTSIAADRSTTGSSTTTGSSSRRYPHPTSSSSSTAWSTPSHNRRTTPILSRTTAILFGHFNNNNNNSAPEEFDHPIPSNHPQHQFHYQDRDMDDDEIDTEGDVQDDRENGNEPNQRLLVRDDVHHNGIFHFHNATQNHHGHSHHHRPTHTGPSAIMDRLRSYLFGFLYEEMELEDSIDYYRSHHHHHPHNQFTFHTRRRAADASFWYVVVPLSISLALQSMATSMIYSIISNLGHEIIATTVVSTWTAKASSISSSTSSSVVLMQQIQQWVQQIVSVSLCGTAIGKFANGPVVDIYGARRTLILYTSIMCTAIFLLGIIPTTTTDTLFMGLMTPPYWVATLIFILEFVSSVQWPCTIVILATHYRRSTATAPNFNEDESEEENGTAASTTTAAMTNHHHSPPAPNSGRSWYESGIFVTSLSSRVGSMTGILVSSSLMMFHQIHWRTIVVYGAAYSTTIAVSIQYLYVRDSPRCPNVPQNPIDPNLYTKWFPEQVLLQNHQCWSINRLLRLLMFIVQTNVLPSVRHILGSSTFWIVTLSHTGSSMVRTSQRLLGSYFLMTSDGTLSYEQAVSYSIWYSIGTVLGLFIAGTIFTKGCRNDRQRKYMILRLYVVTIVSCYILSIAAIPRVRNWIQAPELIRIIQTMAVTTIGFGVAVQLYHIPSLVGATFGCDKGLFISYNDGVAYFFVAMAWRYVGRVMQVDSQDDDGGGGWAYGWAAVALLLIVSAVLMVEFMEHYFCRPKYGVGSGGMYETIIFS